MSKMNHDFLVGKCYRQAECNFHKALERLDPDNGHSYYDAKTGLVTYKKSTIVEIETYVMNIGILLDKMVGLYEDRTDELVDLIEKANEILTLPDEERFDV